jgi:hypothetical protein
MNALAILLQYWKPLVIVLLLLVSNAWSLNHGMVLVEREQDAAISRQRENNLKVNTEVSDALQKKYASLRHRYDDIIRMRQTGGLLLSPTTGRPDAAPCTNGLSGEILSLMLQADLNTQQLIALQTWIKTIGK